MEASTRLTHTDPRALEGARAVALCAAHAVEAARGTLRADEALRDLRAAAADPEFARLLEGIAEHLASGSSVEDYADALGLRRGVSGYVYHTVPVCIYSWLRSGGEFRRAVEGVIRLGGDADTTGAITGALAGATVGASGIPEEWLHGIAEWPRSVRWMRTVAERLARRFPAEGPGEEARPAGLFWPAIPLLNALFLAVVLLHGLRRLLPPY